MDNSQSQGTELKSLINMVKLKWIKFSISVPGRWPYEALYFEIHQTYLSKTDLYGQHVKREYVPLSHMQFTGAYYITSICGFIGAITLKEKFHKFQ